MPPLLLVSAITPCRALPYDDFLSSAVEEEVAAAEQTERERGREEETTSMSRSIKSAVSEAALNARQ